MGKKIKLVFKRLCLAVAALLLICLVVLTLALPSAVLWFFNNRLSGIIGAEAFLESVDISLFRGAIEFKGLALEQPAGFEGDRLLSIEKGRVQLDLAGVFKRSIVLDVSGEQISANLIRSDKGMLNVQSLFPGIVSEEPVGEDVVEKKTFQFALQQVSLGNIALSYHDRALDDLSVCLTNMDITVRDLVFMDGSDTHSDSGEGLLEINGEIVQPGASNAVFSTKAEIRPAADSIPDVDFSLTLTGLQDNYLCRKIPDELALLFGAGPFCLKLDAGFGDNVLTLFFNLSGPDEKKVVSLEDMKLDFNNGTLQMRNFLLPLQERFGEKPCLSVADLSIAVELDSLESKAFVVKSALIGRPELNIDRNRDGASLLDVILASVNDNTDLKTENEAKTGSPFSLVVEHFELSDGAGVYKFPGPDETASLISLSHVDFKMSGFSFTTGPDTPGFGATDAAFKLEIGNSGKVSLFKGDWKGLSYDNGFLRGEFAVNMSGIEPVVFDPVLPMEYIPPVLSEPFNMNFKASVEGKKITASALVERQDAGAIVALDRFELDAATGTAGLAGLIVSEPDIAENPGLLRLANMDIKFDPDAFSTEALIVESCRIKGLEVGLNSEDGEMNVFAFLPRSVGTVNSKAGSGPDSNNTGLDEKSTDSASDGTAFVLRKLEMSDSCFSFKTIESGSESISVALTNVSVFATNFSTATGTVVRPDEAGGFSARAYFSQAPSPAALLSVSGNLSFPDNIPSVEASFSARDFNPSVAGLNIPARSIDEWTDSIFDIEGSFALLNDDVGGNFVFKDKSGRPLVSLGNARFSIREKSGVISDLAVSQPPGFGDGVLFAVSEVAVVTGVDYSTNSSLRINEARIDNPRLFLTRNSKGVANTDFFFYTGNADSEPMPEEKDQPVPGAEEKNGVVVVFEKVHLDNMEFKYEDYSFASDTPLLIHSTNINFAATNIAYHAVAEPADRLPGTISLTGAMLQKRGYNGFFGVFAETGPFSAGYPSINAAIRVTGLELQTLSPLVPAGTSKAIGGEALDIAADIAFARDLLDVRLKGVTVAGHALPLLRLAGTPQNPDIRVSRIILGIGARLGGAVGNVARNITDATKDVAGTAARTTVSIGRTAFQTISSVGAGVAKTAKGVVSADVAKVKEGLKKATVGTVTETFVTIYDITDDLAHDASGAARAGIGEKQRIEWRENNFRRWEKEWIKAVEKVQAMPYPPERGEPDRTFLSW